MPVGSLAPLQSKIFYQSKKFIPTNQKLAASRINTGTWTMKNIDFINVMENSYSLWEYCKQNNWTDDTFEDFCDGGGELEFFEGDPDIIKVHGNIGYFSLCGNKCFYWFDDWTGEAEAMLKAFYAAFETGVTLGGAHYRIGEAPAGVVESEQIQNWSSWEKINTGIAWRGGAGYHYHIQAWGNWLARA